MKPVDCFIWENLLQNASSCIFNFTLKTNASLTSFVSVKMPFLILFLLFSDTLKSNLFWIDKRGMCGHPTNKTGLAFVLFWSSAYSSYYRMSVKDGSFISASNWLEPLKGVMEEQLGLFGNEIYSFQEYFECFTICYKEGFISFTILISLS